MSLEYDLEPKLAEIRTLAKERYGLYLGALGLKFNENGVIVSDPENLVVVDPPPDVEREREKWRTCLNEVTELVTRFRSLYCMEPLDFTLLVGRLGGMRREGVVTEPLVATSVHDRLDYADDEWVSRVDGMINEGQWTGDAANNFHENFLFKFHTAVEQQKAYVRELAFAGLVYHRAAADAGVDVRRIADGCIARLSGDYGQPLGFFSTVGIVSGVLGFIPGHVGMAANVLGLASGLLSMMIEEAEREDTTPREMRVDGGNAPQIVQSTWDALDALEGIIAETDDKLGRGFNWALSSSQGFASRDLEVERPDLADRQDTFGDLNITDPSGVPLAESEVVASVVDIYRAGYVNLPGAAEQYGEAVTILDSCAITASVSRFFPRSIPKFDEARDILSGILGHTGANLADAGTALVETALGYGDTDEEGAEAMRRIGEIDPPPPAVPDTHPRRPPL